MSKTITLGITLGDVGGIGPEVALKAACAARWPGNWRLVLIGSRAVVRAERAGREIPAWPGTGPLPAPVCVWEPRSCGALKAAPGMCRAAAARCAVDWIRAGVEGCQRGALDGLVTAPISKAGLHRAGIDFPGHTELLAQLTGTRRFAMMLMGGPLRVVLVTRHIPLAAVPAAVTPAGIVEAATLAAQALPWLGVRSRTVGVCALNRHAGDGGVIGDEERRLIRPALRRLRARGVPVEGPVPADVIFGQALRGRYGAVVALYHDQGLGPLKMLYFDRGINLTLGLPIVRTSPDHGTAYDIAGRGTANPESMIAAVRLAGRLAGRRNPWRNP